LFFGELATIGTFTVATNAREMMDPALGLVQETARADLSWADLYPCEVADLNKVMNSVLVGL
jgi:hypothetical protein